MKGNEKRKREQKQKKCRWGKIGGGKSVERRKQIYRERKEGKTVACWRKEKINEGKEQAQRSEEEGETTKEERKRKQGNGRREKEKGRRTGREENGSGLDSVGMKEE